MCDSYGVCGAADTQSRGALSPLPTWSEADVSAFTESLAENGSRNTCPAGCRTPSLFANSSSRLASLRMSGHALHALLQAQSTVEASLRNA